MDLRRPGTSGTEAIRALRENDRATPRILVLTTYGTDRDICSALEAGADGYLLKDAYRDDVIRTVHGARCTVHGARRRGGPPRARSGGAGRSHRGPRTPGELSVGEAEALRLVADGCTNRAVASRLGIGEATVKTHLMHVYEKLGVRDRAAAVRTAWGHGLV